jgi:uracil-DNA glycosylase
MTRPYVFPFGRPLEPCCDSAIDPRQLLVLGAYPSALHVSWHALGYRPVKAVAVDNEPEPFWNGANQAERIERWKHAVGFDPARHGSISIPKRLNGPSGQWVDDNVFRPLGIPREVACVTDCLTEYHCSVKLLGRLRDTYEPFAKEAGLPQASLPEHPSEHEIVRRTISGEMHRLDALIRAVKPELIVTLGNAALRVMRVLLGDPIGPHSLSPQKYGESIRIFRAGLVTLRYPLAHPAAPRPYQEAHLRWIESP